MVFNVLKLMFYYHIADMMHMAYACRIKLSAYVQQLLNSNNNICRYKPQAIIVLDSGDYFFNNLHLLQYRPPGTNLIKTI